MVTGGLEKGGNEGGSALPPQLWWCMVALAGRGCCFDSPFLQRYTYPMKLFLSSAGFYTPKLVQAFVQLCGKAQNEISFAVINEGYAVELDDKRWVLDDLNRIVTNFAGSFDLINLLALSLEQVRARILKQDALFVVGGHTDYLMSVFDRTGFSKLLPELLASKVYVGSSAGSMVLGKRIGSAAYREVYGEGSAYDAQRYLQFVDFAIKPHLDSPHFPKNRIEVLQRVVRPEDGVVYGLKDDNAIIVDGSRVSFANGEPYRVLA